MSEAENKNKEITYEKREKLDDELNTAIADILSAERRAQGIIARAAETVKSIQLDGANRERDMRTAAINDAARRRDDAVKDAEARGDAEAARIRAQAEKSGAELLSSKKRSVEKIATELFESL